MKTCKSKNIYCFMFALLLLSLLTLMVIASPIEADITVPGQGVWLFDQDAAGTSVYDSSVYRHDGTRTVSVATSTDTPFEYSGNLSTAFDGTGGYISIPAGVGILKEDSATVECWFKFSSGALQAGTHQIVGGKLYGNNFLINQYGETLYVYWKSGSPIVRLNGILGGMLDQWNHIAVAVSGGTVSVYLNGEFQESQAVGTNAFNLATVNIGGNEHYPGWNMNGLVDEVRFLNYPLGAGDIMGNYQASLKKEHALPGLDRNIALYQTEFSPAVLLHSMDTTIRLFQDMVAFGLGAPTYVSAVNNTGAVSVYQSGIDSIPADISESWLLVWFKGGAGWDDIQFIQKPDTAHGGWDGAVESPEPVGEFDVPWLIVLQHLPDSISAGSSGMELTFADSVGYLRMMPLYGVKRFSLNETVSWSGGLPSDVVQRSRQWASMLQMYPIGVQERFSVDRGADAIKILNEFEYIRIEDDWDTSSTLIAPIPPVLGLIIRYGEDDNLAGPGNHLVSFEQNIIDRDLMTPFGPLYSTESDHNVEFTLNGLIKYADEVAFVNGPVYSQFDGAVIDDLTDRLDNAINSQYAGKLTSPNPTTGSFGLVYDNRYEWEAFDWMRLGIASSLIAKMRPYLSPAREAAVLPILNSVLDEYLNIDNYASFRDNDRDIDYLMHKKRWLNNNWSDSHAFASTLHSMYVLASELGRMDEITANWDMVRKIWNGAQKQEWITFPSSAEGDHLNPMITGSWAMARMAAYVGDQENYDLGVYSGARFLLNRYATLRASDYAAEMDQWMHWRDPDKDYFYFSTRNGDTDRLKWAFNTVGFKFFDAELTGSFGWRHTFITMLIEENFDRFYHEKAPYTAGNLMSLINTNAITEEKLSNGVTTDSTHSYHWEMVSWQRDKRGDQVELIIDMASQETARLDIRSMSRTSHGIYYPSNFDVFYKDGNDDWQPFGSTSPVDEGVSDAGGNGAWHTFMVTGTEVVTGQLKIVATLNGCCSNYTAYWFSDEIEVFNSSDESVTVDLMTGTPSPNYLTRGRDWFAVDQMLVPLSMDYVYDRLINVHAQDTPLLDNLWRTLHSGESNRFRSVAPVGFSNNTYWPGLDRIRNESRSVGLSWIINSYKNRLQYAEYLSPYAMLSKNYWDVETPGWPLLSWYGFIAPEAPNGMKAEIQNVLPFGFVKPSEDVSTSWLTARIVRSSNLAGVYTVGDTLAAWPMSEGGGLRVNDVSDNGNDIFLQEGSSQNPTWNEESQGMDFDGIDDVVVIKPENEWFLFENNGYIEIWVKFKSLPSGTHEIIGGREYGRNFLLSQYGDDLYVYWKKGSTRTRLYDVFEVNKWYRVAVANNDGLITARVDELNEGDGTIITAGESSVDIGYTAFDKIEIDIGANTYYANWNIDGTIRDVKICSSSVCLQEEGGICTDSDGDRIAVEGGLCGPVDYDDNNPYIYPGAEEICDGVDNNGDGAVDEGFIDTDLDYLKDCVDSDDDNDGLTDNDEATIYGTDPLILDTDGDSLDDGIEIQLGTSALHPDTDRDNIHDGLDPEPLNIFSPNNEGWNLSRNSDFSTSDTTFSPTDTLHILAWTNRVDANNLRKANYRIKEGKKKVLNGNLSAGAEFSTYETSVDISSLSSGEKELLIHIEDQSRVRYKVKKIYIDIQ